VREHLNKAETIQGGADRLSKESRRTSRRGLKIGLRGWPTRRKELAHARPVKRDWTICCLRVPNLFDESVPVGKSEADNV